MFIFPEIGIGIAVLVNMNDYLVGDNLINNIIYFGRGLTEVPLWVVCYFVKDLFFILIVSELC